MNEMLLFSVSEEGEPSLCVGEEPFFFFNFVFREFIVRNNMTVLGEARYVKALSRL